MIIVMKLPLLSLFVYFTLSHGLQSQSRFHQLLNPKYTTAVPVNYQLLSASPSLKRSLFSSISNHVHDDSQRKKMGHNSLVHMEIDDSNHQIRNKLFSNIYLALKKIAGFTIKFILPVIVISLFVFVTKSYASSSTLAKEGYDLYGRVPYDDWLYSNWRLTDPNLLKRSYAETVFHYIASTLVCLFWTYAGISLYGAYVNNSWKYNKKRMQEFDAILGRSMPISAQRKGGLRRGKELKGSDGWINMEAIENEEGDDDDDDDDKAN